MAKAMVSWLTRAWRGPQDHDAHMVHWVREQHRLSEKKRADQAERERLALRAQERVRTIKRQYDALPEPDKKQRHDELAAAIDSELFFIRAMGF